MGGFPIRVCPTGDYPIRSWKLSHKELSCRDRHSGGGASHSKASYRRMSPKKLSHRALGKRYRGRVSYNRAELGRDYSKQLIALDL